MLIITKVFLNVQKDQVFKNGYIYRNKRPYVSEVTKSIIFPDQFTPTIISNNILKYFLINI
jgi:hypothetical protein